ncbi:MAG: choice-of-anchor L domain-containing protein [Brumimicrobium sp.]|nr:choice-of-anchor L domain-containing protein [Brumimicrobium sp.]
MRKTINYYIILILFCISTLTHGQTITLTNTSPTNAIQNVLLGGGLTATNVTYNGSAPNANINQDPVKIFDATSTSFPMSNGVLIRTKNAPSINDPDLVAIGGDPTNGVIIEFDFIPTGATLTFNYIFGSSEYNLYTCSDFNDVFGFFLSGPGISGPYSNNAINLAVVPGSPNIPVGINTVNSGNAGWNDPNYCSNMDPNWQANSVYFTTAYNTLFTNSQIVGELLFGMPILDDLNGCTVVLPANAPLQCNQTYHIKIAICNSVDTGMDSAVFLQADSFESDPDDVQVNPAASTICTGGSVNLTASSGSGNYDWSQSPNAADISPQTGANVTVTPPATPGTYMYVVTDVNSCGYVSKDTAYVTVQSCQSCLINNFEANIAACDGPTNTFTISGIVEFTDAPTTGQLIVSDCNGHQQTFNAPFTSPISYSISGIPADGANCSITAQFSADPTCTSTISYTNPSDCSCIVNIGTFDINLIGDGQQNYKLCYGDILTIDPNGGFVPSADLGGDPMLPAVYLPGVGYMVYSCPPTVFPPADLLTDPCFVGWVASSGGNAGDPGIFIPNQNGTPPNFGTPFTNNTLYIVPITMYDTLNGWYSYTNSGDNCYDMGAAIAIQYLPQVISSNPVEDCAAGTFSVSVSGGLPQIDGSNFTASNLLPATASFSTATCANGGTITVTGLQNGDMYSFEITDDNGCPITISGGPFVGGPTADAGSDATAACGVMTYTLAGSMSAGATGTWTGPSGVTFSNASSPTSTITASAAGTYTLTWTVSNGSGCNTVKTVTITFIENPTYTTNNTGSTCGNSDGSLVITASSGVAPYTYSIDNGSSSQGNGTFSNLAAGIYNILVTDANGCSASGTESISNSNGPVINSVTPTNPSCFGMCDGNITANVSSGVAPYTYQWTTNGNPTGSNSDNISGLCAGTYNLKVTDVNGCDVSYNDIVLTQPADINPSFALTDFCEGAINSASNIATPGGVFTFNPSVSDGATINASTGSISNGVGGTTYTVEYTATVNGCSKSSTQTVKVNANPQPNFVGDDLMGCEPHTVTFTNTGTGNNGTCTWNFGDGSTVNDCGTTVSHTYNSAGTYSVSLNVTSAQGCTGSFSIADYISVTQRPIADFSATPMVTNITETEITFTNHSIGATDYIWDFGDASPYTFDINAVHTYPEVPANYTVTLIASNGQDCADTARLVIIIRDELIYYVPNTFTPDADGFNDEFKPIFTSGFDPQVYTLSIYDRWGEILFESHNAEVGWNGTYGGKVVRDGTYIWKIEFKETMSDQHHTEVGHVNVLR